MRVHSVSVCEFRVCAGTQCVCVSLEFVRVHSVCVSSPQFSSRGVQCVCLFSQHASAGPALPQSAGLHVVSEDEQAQVQMWSERGPGCRVHPHRAHPDVFTPTQAAAALQQRQRERVWSLRPGSEVQEEEGVFFRWETSLSPFTPADGVRTSDHVASQALLLLWGGGGGGGSSS